MSWFQIFFKVTFENRLSQSSDSEPEDWVRPLKRELQVASSNQLGFKHS